MSDHTARIEEAFEDGDFIVALDGPVVEVFFGARAISHRRHVSHLNVDFVKNRKGETIMVIGRKDHPGIDPERSEIRVTDADKGRINALIEEAIARGGKRGT